MRKFKLSVAKKTVLWVVFVAIVVGTFAIAIYNKGSYDLIITQYEHYSTGIAKLVAVEVDSEQVLNVQKAIRDTYDHSENKVMSDRQGTPEFESYVAQFEYVKEMDDYKEVLADLQRMQDELDVDCIYITWVDPANECYVYLVDAAHEDPCPPGCIDPIYVEDKVELLKNLKTAGLPPNITKTQEYGWLMATGMPIYDGNGELIAMADVDISMNVAMSELTSFMNKVIYSFLAMTVIIAVLAIIMMRTLIIKPIRILSNAAKKHKNNNTIFSELNLKRNDEIGVLADSMATMEKDINSYIIDLISAREHAEKMDLEANTDALTKVFNKRAYDQKVCELNKDKPQYGIAMIDINNLKEINDKYGHEKGDICIQTICQSICSVFSHSAVYRVGGDEFIVVMENDAYEKHDELVNELSNLFRTAETDNSLEPWERASAAIGYAVFDSSSDESVESVEKRADTDMYENKKQWKNEINTRK